jgi:pimeloyl-ACP methyl ester carboxylesterase
MTTFVLVPGAWLGAWAWEDTAQALRAHGHTALPLTLTGLGEYAGRGTPETDLEIHIADITGFVGQRDLRDITLVAHSYAGAPVTGAAARLGDRLERVVQPEIDAAGDPTGQQHDHGEQRAEDTAGDPKPAALRLRLPVEADRRERSRGENRPAIAVDGGPAADSSLERGSHVSGKSENAVYRRPQDTEDIPRIG